MTNTQLQRIGSDPDAFEELYREHLAAVERFVARRVGDPHTAADLTADVFLAAVDASHSYRSDRGAPVAWLMGIARNVVADERRRRGRELRAAPYGVSRAVGCSTTSRSPGSSSGWTPKARRGSSTPRSPSSLSMTGPCSSSSPSTASKLPTMSKRPRARRGSKR